MIVIRVILTILIAVLKWFLLCMILFLRTLLLSVPAVRGLRARAWLTSGPEGSTRVVFSMPTCCNDQRYVGGVTMERRGATGEKCSPCFYYFIFSIKLINFDMSLVAFQRRTRSTKSLDQWSLWVVRRFSMNQNQNQKQVYCQECFHKQTRNLFWRKVQESRTKTLRRRPRRHLGKGGWKMTA